MSRAGKFEIVETLKGSIKITFYRKLV